MHNKVEFGGNELFCSEQNCSLSPGCSLSIYYDIFESNRQICSISKARYSLSSMSLSPIGVPEAGGPRGTVRRVK